MNSKIYGSLSSAFVLHLNVLSHSLFLTAEDQTPEKRENENIPPSRGWEAATGIRTPYVVISETSMPSRYSDTGRSPHKRLTSTGVSQPHNTDDRSRFSTTDSPAKSDTSDDCHANEDNRPSSPSKAVEQVAFTPVLGGSLRSRLEAPMMLPPPPPTPRPRRLLLPRPQNPHDWPHRYQQRMNME